MSAVKLPNRFEPAVFALLMSGIMAFSMSGILTLMNLGLVPDFPTRWIQAFALAYAIAFPLTLVVTPVTRTVVRHLLS